MPTHILTSFYRRDHVEGTPLVNPAPGPAGHGGGFAVLTAQGFEPDTITEALHARMPTPDEVRELQLPVGEPVVVLKRTTVTQDGQAVEFARGVHAAARFEWFYRFKISE